MKIEAKKSFNKDIEKITDRKLALRIKSILLYIESVKNTIEIPNLKKMHGADNAYRIRIGDYRLGFFLVNGIVELTIFAHRKEIYRYFP